jgi:hypothetical protein
LERLGGLAQPEAHEGKFKQAEWSGNCGLLYIFVKYWNLIISSHQVDFREDGTTEKLVG